MKIPANTVLLPIIISGVGAERKRGAWYVGRTQARIMWDLGVGTGLYDCDEHFDVLEVFRDDVELDVYEQCEDLFWWSNRRFKDCKDGANEFVVEKAAECHDPMEDCTVLAMAAAGGVAAEFCEYYPRFSTTGASIYPPGCVLTAKDKCRAKVLDEVQVIAQDDHCGRLHTIGDLTMDDRRELRQMCDDEVEALVNEPI